MHYYTFKHCKIYKQIACYEYFIIKFMKISLNCMIENDNQITTLKYNSDSFSMNLLLIVYFLSIRTQYIVESKVGNQFSMHVSGFDWTSQMMLPIH